jgi:glycosyltransferase involved in cell wall biosynthesis
MPTYQHAPYVREAIASILAQTHPRVHAVVADDGSTDGTKEIVEELGAAHPDVLTIVTVDRNTGVAKNVNRAIERLDGDYIALFSGDDVMVPDRLARSVAALEADPGVALVHGDAEVLQSPGDRLLGRFTHLMNGQLGTRSGGIELLFDTSYLMLPSTFMFPSRLLPPGPFDERLRFANELIWHIEIVRHGRVLGLDDVLVRYRRHPSNMTSDRGYDADRLEEFLMTMAMATARHPELHGLAQRRSAGYLLEAARQAQTAGERRRAARYGLAAMRHAGPVRGGLEALRLLRTQRRRAVARAGGLHEAMWAGER